MDENRCEGSEHREPTAPSVVRQLPRDDQGRFFTRKCVDPKCDGELAFDEHWQRWRCNGLTHRADGPLEECTYSHHDGEVREAPHDC